MCDAASRIASFLQMHAARAIATPRGIQMLIPLVLRADLFTLARAARVFA